MTITELRALAIAATPGPYCVIPAVRTASIWEALPNGETGLFIAGSGRMVPEMERQALLNIAYLAACSPDLILALCDLVEAAREFISAADRPIRFDDDDIGLVNYGEADHALRAALAKVLPEPPQ